MEKSEAEWKKQLDSESYNVLRMKGTEAAFSGKYHDSKAEGMFVCKGCGLELFSSDTKFDSGTGWPSFSEAKDSKNVKLITDGSHGMQRVEAVCAGCGGHLGHVFDDGPKEKGGKRFCINSCSLDLKEK
ncbi:peptide-methionine (R)-S-oxide reductase MsrB [archaeon]|jgi:peptide-methionine (R)-S-oxide reductase|nr:peptide-methionine (R)-S-oxide reductase MsrB [archaeon]MBT6762181.1 peptide-methionine (R)-S-oxide reductase MsrB [archaeon]